MPVIIGASNVRINLYSGTGRLCRGAEIKMYLTSISSSALVGYADIDGASSLRDAVSAYLLCDTSIDLFGLNNY
ncbi:hypothetical protein B0H14DRAFT_3543631 [Mycena olivaceomarginata]|nr:hypothetical protein B0H14DRAFT_3543631 [Mycena olivaceomarginata]